VPVFYVVMKRLVGGSSPSPELAPGAPQP